jgi:hypothetical protein
VHRGRRKDKGRARQSVSHLLSRNIRICSINQAKLRHLSALAQDSSGEYVGGFVRGFVKLGGFQQLIVSLVGDTLRI